MGNSALASTMMPEAFEEGGRYCRADNDSRVPGLIRLEQAAGVIPPKYLVILGGNCGR
jgi:hypothetical protein